MIHVQLSNARREIPGDHSAAESATTAALIVRGNNVQSPQLGHKQQLQQETTSSETNATTTNHHHHHRHHDHSVNRFRYLRHLRDRSHLGKTSPGKTRTAFLLERLLGTKQAAHQARDQNSEKGRRHRTSDKLDGPHVQAMNTKRGAVEQAFEGSKKKIYTRGRPARDSLIIFVRATVRFQRVSLLHYGLH